MLYDVAVNPISPRAVPKSGVRSAECGVRSAECGVRSAECGVRSAECGVRSAECGVRSAECGVRSAECGVRSLKKTIKRLTVFCEMKRNETKWIKMYWNEYIQCHYSQIPPCHNLNKEQKSGSTEYANLKICILRSEFFEDCDYIQLISSDCLTLFVYTTPCSNDFEPKQGIKQRKCRICKFENLYFAKPALRRLWLYITYVFQFFDAFRIYNTMQ